jgi:allantoicase
MFFGHRHHLIYPGPPRGMFDGWETKRRRGPGHDWAVVGLGAPGTIRRAVVDTRFFQGNAPGWCSLDGTTTLDGEDGWRELLPRVPLAADREQSFAAELVPHEAVARVRLNIYPDGGVARLRLFGRPAR